MQYLHISFLTKIQSPSIHTTHAALEIPDSRLSPSNCKRKLGILLRDLSPLHTLYPELLLRLLVHAIRRTGVLLQ